VLKIQNFKSIFNNCGRHWLQNARYSSDVFLYSWIVCNIPDPRSAG